jgi:hypothetical protein
MMLSLVAVLMTAAPGHASLLAPVESLPSSTRLLAQATSQSQPLSEPPLPPSGLAADARIRELTLRIDELNQRIADLGGNHLGASALGFLGYALTLGLVVGPLLILVDGAFAPENDMLLPGLGITAAGVVGILLAAYAISIKSDRKTEQGRLAVQRADLLQEMEALKARQSPAAHRRGPVRRSATFTVLALAF